MGFASLIASELTALLLSPETSKSAKVHFFTNSKVLGVRKAYISHFYPEILFLPLPWSLKGSQIISSSNYKHLPLLSIAFNSLSVSHALSHFSDLIFQLTN